MFGTLGGPELVLILVVALIVFGPRKLPEIGKSMGKMLVEFRRASTEFKRTIETEVETEHRRTEAPAPTASAAPSPPPANESAAALPPQGATAGPPETPESPRPPEGSVARGAADPPSGSES